MHTPSVSASTRDATRELPNGARHARPRVLIVSRRHIRKNKYVDFVGEYHLDLVVEYGACPLIIPRVAHISELLDMYEPIHGVLLGEGEDISPGYLAARARALNPEQLRCIRKAHPSDTALDVEKDGIEFALVERCIQRGIPLLGICRGSQIVNVACGGSIHADVALMLNSTVKHIDYENYDDHRHPVDVVPDTPLSAWFDGASSLRVNSYHHQGVDALAPRFVPMARAPDGLVEAFYDPQRFGPHKGEFLVGLQFHPERMQDTTKALGGQKHTYQYPGCPRVYRDFVHAARAYCERSMVKSMFENVALRNLPCAAYALGDGKRQRMKKMTSLKEGKLERVMVRLSGNTVQQGGPLGLGKGVTCAKGLRRGTDDSALPMTSYYGAVQTKRAMVIGKGVTISVSHKGGGVQDRAVALSHFSAGELDRLARCGATVHGGRWALRLLEDQDRTMLDPWKRFENAMTAAVDSLIDLCEDSTRLERATGQLEMLARVAASLAVLQNSAC